jgi:hypothetical protein
LKSGKAEGPTIERGFGIDADSPFAVGTSLIEGNDARIDLGDCQKEILVADAREAVFLLGGGEAGKIVDIAGFDSKNVLPDAIRKRSLSEKLQPFEGLC